ncbi:NAD(P)/FAD-dependent oxidoreductase [Anaerosacchariphilus polymeriproducens]|uniref:FAD-binding oxidoreductase n=1 Tax=Anaerosacchariphilus polymeriproducens TaxID=1812858 RepID=A0A371AVT7_9FIRM|nr:FAD-binding oxidoreductase [Anaerosacchariphilus polymeriproducens]RDU23687.1 FAD-binding oxidoreductase [Anaerosacchariphilus polymeriproducens]
MSHYADVIVIGGGIIGNSTAYYLAKKGCSVLVLEKSDHMGNGGSGRNGGGVRQSGRDKRELPLAMYGVKNLWPALSDELETDVEYYQEGNLRLGKTDEHIKILECLTNDAASLGLDVRMIEGIQAKEICPYLSEEVIGASWCPTDGHANPMLATLGYYRKARQLGARFVTGEEVIEIKKIKGKARQVVTSENCYETETIILAAGYDSRKIAATVGINVPMLQSLLEVLVTEAQPPMFYQMLGTAAADFYGHQSTHGSFVFGGSSGFEGVNKNNGTPVTNSITASCICRGIMKYLPCLGDAKIVRTWAGWIDDCVDHVPVISRVEEVPGLILACGFSGHGFGISPTVGTLLSQMAVGEETVLDITDFRYDRFKAKI